MQIGQFSQFLLADFDLVAALADGPAEHLSMFPLHRLQRNQERAAQTTVDRL